MLKNPSGSNSRAAFRHRPFRYYIPARFLITVASEMQAVAVAWQIYDLTRRPLDLGLVGLAQFLPGICLFLVAGHVADRVPRQKILQVCWASFAVCSLLLFAFTLHGLSSPLPIYVVILLNGFVRAFNAPASQAFVPLLVPQEDFPNAIAWSSSIFQIATITGPMLGGLIYGLTGRPTTVFASSAAAYTLAFVLLRQVHVAAVRTPGPTSGRTVLEGLSFIWRNKIIMGAISLDLFAVLLGGAVALLPVYAREILKIGATGLGILRCAPGVGAVLMGMVMAHWPLKRRAGLIMLWCVFAFGVFTVIFGLSHELWISLFMLFLIGASDSVSVIVRHTMIQLSTPDEMRGRVSAVNTVFIGASNEVGQFESGITAQWFGTVPAVVIGGVGTMVIVAAWSALFPKLRKMDNLLPDMPVLDLPEQSAREAGAAAD
ncbi:MAG TPA: MFS transporter [Bryobacteraceae bacterium]|nr:MFS transporter [Bryobacteraceae bacterium]